MNRRRLYRCRHDQRLAGVASGLAEYFDLDVSLIRVLWVVSIFFGGLGLLLYILLAIVVPMEPEYYGPPAGGGQSVPGDASAGAEADSAAAGTPGAEGAAGAPSIASGYHSGWYTAPEPHRHVGHGSGIGMTFFGMLLVIFGALALIDAYLPGWADGGRFLWPAFILSIGALLVATALRRRPNEP